MNNAIDIITGRLKQDFDFMVSKGYAFKPVELYNPNNRERIFAKVKLKNESLNRELTFTIYPRIITEVEIYITDCSADKSMNFKHYIEFKKGNTPQSTSQFQPMLGVITVPHAERCLEITKRLSLNGTVITPTIGCKICTKE